MAEVTTFAALDYLILAIVFIASLGIGFYFACFGGKQKTTKEYFKGDKNMSPLLVVLSMMASFLSSHGMLGIPAEVYHFGFNYWYTNLGCIVGVPIAVYGFMPVFYKLQITSVFEYIECRFNKHLRLIGSIMYILTLLFFASFVTYGPALALSQVTGLSVWSSVLTTTAIGTIYTSIGGIKAVMWADSLQILIFTAALIATLIKGSLDVGGISYIIDKSIKGGRLGPLSFSMDPRIRFTFWGLFISSSFSWMQSYGTSQIQIQRYMTCPNRKIAERSIWINVLSCVPVRTIYCFVGLSLYALYWNCDPLSSQQIEQPDQIFPLFVIHTMSSIPGMLGIFVAGVYSASLSTTSSVLNSLAAITLEDHVKPRWKGLSDEKATFISKLIAVSYGVVCILVIAAIMNLGSIIQAIYYLIGGTNGATLGLFVLGLMNPCANSKGSIIGILSGLGIGWWISIGNQIYHPPPFSKLPVSTENCTDVLGDWIPRVHSYTNGDDILDIYKISYFWITPLAFVVTVIVGSICSIFIGSNENLNMNLLSPFVHKIMKRFFLKKYQQLVCNYKPVEQIPKKNKELNGYLDVIINSDQLTIKNGLINEENYIALNGNHLSLNGNHLSLEENKLYSKLDAPINNESNI